MTDSAVATKGEPAFGHAHAALLRHADIQFNLPTFQAPKRGPQEWYD